VSQALFVLAGLHVSLTLQTSLCYFKQLIPVDDIALGLEMAGVFVSLKFTPTVGLLGMIRS
jgi:hypothetical protein